MNTTTVTLVKGGIIYVQMPERPDSVIYTGGRCTHRGCPLCVLRG